MSCPPRLPNPSVVSPSPGPFPLRPPSFVLAGWLVFLPHLIGTAAEPELDFNRDVRPILSDKCYACHGPDSDQRQANLRLDIPDGAFADLGGYAAIVAGQPEASELVRRITAPEDAMPPAEQTKQLSHAEKAVLIHWIRQGARWQDHWSYVKPQRYPVPENTRVDWTRNFVDAFVLERLHAAGMEPSEPADPRTLLRRLSFDLIGLPPKPEDVEAFARDHSSTAYEAIVDQLLSSSHFGERLAMYWLDLVRYADTVGYHGDQDVSVSPYRDYVIHAFNRNMPFDQFTREQLAGDLLEQPTRDQLVASGYNKLGMMSAEGGVQPEEYLAKYAADRVRNAATVWLGSTLGCAECHDHKFDPFTSEDFYRFASFFADIQERGLYSGANRDGNWGPTIEVTDPELDELLKPIDAKADELQATLDASTPELEQAQRTWAHEQRENLKLWETWRPVVAQAQHGTTLQMQNDGTILAQGANPDQNTYTLSGEIRRADVKAIRLEALPDASLPQQGPGRAGNGNLVLTEIKLFRLAANGEEIRVPIGNATATIEQKAGSENPYETWSAASAIDHDRQGSSWGWAILPEIGKPQALVVVLSDSLPAGSLKVVLEQNHTNPKHTLGKFRISASHEAPDLKTPWPALLPERVRQALAVDADQRTREQTQAITTYYRQTTPILEPIRQKLKEVQDQRKQLVAKHTRTSLITVTVPPRQMRVLHRGNWMDKTGDVVQPGVPARFAQLEADERATRLDLANWLVSPDNPLVARVFVNRLWKLYFGTGLCKSLDDLGSQGEMPSHPELLDTLSVEFVESGWDVKHVIKLIVMSNTYRQSSLMREELRTRDPYNRMLARQSRFRLDAELIRDNALAISGLLSPKVGGRSTKPYQPSGLYRHLNFPRRTYQHDTGFQQYRRGVYTHWQRQFLHPAMQAFDAPSREECTAERPRSNTPLAALVLLNDPSYVEAARRFAERILEAEEKDTPVRLQWMMQEALSRNAVPEELNVLTSLVMSELDNYRTRPEDARQLIQTGLSQPSSSIDTVELAAWTSVARAILNMHETVTRN